MSIFEFILFLFRILFPLHNLKIRIRPLGIELLIGPHHRNQILRLGQIDNIMGIARQHMHCLDLLS